VDSFIPKLEHFIDFFFTVSFQKEAFEISFMKNCSWNEAEVNLSSAEENFPDEITWIT